MSEPGIPGPGLASLLPARFAVVETRADVPETTLFPSEREYVRDAVDGRRQEFATVRHCARRALDELGLPAEPIRPGPAGAPIWPRGVVGSMTHCEGYRAAALAEDDGTTVVGIDAELDLPLPDGVLDLITVPQEREAARRGTQQIPGCAWDRLLFSAKESIYKAWYPLTGRWLDFTECLLTVGPGVFEGRLLVAGPRLASGELRGFRGRWMVQRRYLLTAVCVATAADPRR